MKTHVMPRLRRGPHLTPPAAKVGPDGELDVELQKPAAAQATIDEGAEDAEFRPLIPGQTSSPEPEAMPTMLEPAPNR